MAQTIQIKRSTSTATPSSLSAGELAYSGKSDSNKLFIGHPDGTTGPVAIGGQYYTGVIDGAASANTASKLVVRDGSGNFSAGTITAALTGNVTGTVSDVSNHDTDDITEGSTNLYHTTARARGAISATGDLSYNSSTGVLSFTQAASAVTSVNSATGAVTLDTDDISEGSSNLYYTNARTDTRVDTILKHAGHGNITVADGADGKLVLTAAAQYSNSDARGAISVTDSGGDGSLSYNNSTGVITYTGPSASEVRAHISGGTGVAVSNGAISIGQAVATNSNVTFNNVQVDGTLTSDDITSTNISVAGNATITGNLTVEGTTTTVDSTTVAIGDNIMVLNKDEAGTPSANAGIEVERGTATNVSLLWNETNDNWTVSDGSATSVLLTAANFNSVYTGTIDGGSF
jgi:cytoskeletal protein CcmA (bactofilin family)